MKIEIVIRPDQQDLQDSSPKSYPVDPVNPVFFLKVRCRNVINVPKGCS